MKIYPATYTWVFSGLMCNSLNGDYHKYNGHSSLGSIGILLDWYFKTKYQDWRPWMYTAKVSKCKAWTRNRAFSLWGPHLCESVGTKESVYVRKGLTPLGLVWNTNMAAVSLIWNTNMAALSSCVNAIERVYNLRGWKQKLLGKLFYEFLTRVARKKKSDFANSSRTYYFLVTSWDVLILS